MKLDEVTSKTNMAPLTFPLREVEPDVKFKIQRHSNRKIQIDTSRFEFESPKKRNLTTTNTRKRRNIEEKLSNMIVSGNNLGIQDQCVDEVSNHSENGDDIPDEKAPTRQPPSKRRLLNIETTSASLTEDSISSQTMPPPSSGSVLAENTMEELQPPLPSPSASPMQSQDEEDMLSDEENQERSKQNSYIKIPTTEEGLLTTVERLMDCLSPGQRDYLTWKLVSQTDRSKLSILNNSINKSLKRDLISTLPTEITYKILGYLNARSLIHAEQVCKNWYNIVNTSTGLWKLLIINERYVISELELNKELEKKQELMRDWSREDPSLPSIDVGDDCYKQVYKKRHIIHQRWMDPEYQPRRITVKGNGSAVITCLQFDDDKIITGADDNIISIYDTKTGRLRKSLEGHTGGVWALKYYKNTLVSGATDRNVRIWNIKQGRCTHVFRGHTSTVRCLDIITPEVIGYAPNGSPIVYPQEPLLITGSRDNSIHVWRLPLAGEDDEIEAEAFDSVEDDNPYFIRALRGHTASVRCISGYGNTVVTGSYDMTVRIWDLCTGRCRLVLRSHTDRVYSTVLDMKRRRVISGSMDATVKIWDLKDGRCLATLEGHTSLVGLLDLSETALVSAAADFTLRVWDPETGDPRFQLKGHMGAITCFQHDDKKVVSGSEKMLKLWDITTGKFVRELLPEISGATWQVRFDYRRCISAVQHRNPGARADETLLEILDFGEPYYVDHEPSGNGSMKYPADRTIVERGDSSFEIDQDGDINLVEEENILGLQLQ